MGAHIAESGTGLFDLLCVAAVAGVVDPTGRYGVIRPTVRIPAWGDFTVDADGIVERVVEDGYARTPLSRAETKEFKHELACDRASVLLLKPAHTAGARGMREIVAVLHAGRGMAFAESEGSTERESV